MSIPPAQIETDQREILTPEEAWAAVEYQFKSAFKLNPRKNVTDHRLIGLNEEYGEYSLHQAFTKTPFVERICLTYTVSSWKEEGHKDLRINAHRGLGFHLFTVSVNGSEEDPEGDEYNIKDILDEMAEIETNLAIERRPG